VRSDGGTAFGPIGGFSGVRRPILKHENFREVDLGRGLRTLESGREGEDSELVRLADCGPEILFRLERPAAHVVELSPIDVGFHQPPPVVRPGRFLLAKRGQDLNRPIIRRLRLRKLAGNPCNPSEDPKYQRRFEPDARVVRKFLPESLVAIEDELGEGLAQTLGIGDQGQILT
jgi:hypothetical protein